MPKKFIGANYPLIGGIKPHVTFNANNKQKPAMMVTIWKAHLVLLGFNQNKDFFHCGPLHKGVADCSATPASDPPKFCFS